MSTAPAPAPAPAETLTDDDAPPVEAIEPHPLPFPDNLVFDMAMALAWKLEPLAAIRDRWVRTLASQDRTGPELAADLIDAMGRPLGQKLETPEYNLACAFLRSVADQATAWIDARHEREREAAEAEARRVAERAEKRAEAQRQAERAELESKAEWLQREREAAEAEDRLMKSIEAALPRYEAWRAQQGQQAAESSAPKGTKTTAKS